MRKILTFLFVALFGTAAIPVCAADISVVPNAEIESDDFVPASEILNREPDETECSTAIFANALAANVNLVDAETHESDVQQWIYKIFALPDVLTAVLQCPEFDGLADDEPIKFIPIEYTFPNGRHIVINYETQPKILQQRITAATKRVITDNNPSPRIGAAGDTSTWMNTDPAWYAIMVVQSGALDAFVGPTKNNTISLQYIYDNIDSLYPSSSKCTSKSALANDKFMINRTVRQTVNMDNDTNDYYVAGDVNLEWISYAEIGLDLLITIGTFGGGAFLAGATKSARAARALKNMRSELRRLSQLDKVRDYIRLQQRSEKLIKQSKNLQRIKNTPLDKDLERAIKHLATTKPGSKAHIAQQAKVEDLTKYVNALDELAKNPNNAAARELLTGGSKSVRQSMKRVLEDNIPNVDDEIKKIAKTMKEMEKTDDVKQFNEMAKTYRELNEYRHTYRGLRTIKSAQRGNIAARLFRAARAANTGADKLNKGAKVARSSMKSGKIRDWLFHSTMRHAGTLARAEEMGGLVYGVLKFVGDMYDHTETSTGQFTNNIEFKPLLLLSADDLQGQDNVVNYGMWLMWAGDSISAADDDAAYLQTMDFAQKFHQDLVETQDAENNHPCNVDIYVVRPVIRNPDSDNPELYYLIMNDQPWSTEN